ncbi:MAG TPA: hypothetical protein VFW68_04685 [Rhodocyclaceae bacterium]|nr:hypothetical protein [Rhodocyclaceae bacterium]
MKVDTLSSGSQTSSSSVSRQPSNDAGFQAALAQAGRAFGGGAQPSSDSTKTASATTPTTQTLKEQYADALSFFKDYLSKTPEQHLREAIMKEMGITEEELAALPPTEHAAKEGEIERRMKERMLGSKDGEKPQDSQQAAAEAAVAGAGSASDPSKPPVNQAVIANLNAAARGLTLS